MPRAAIPLFLPNSISRLLYADHAGSILKASQLLSLSSSSYSLTWIELLPRATTQLNRPGFWGRSNSCEDEAKSAKFSPEVRERAVRLVGSSLLRTKENEPPGTDLVVALLWCDGVVSLSPPHQPRSPSAPLPVGHSCSRRYSRRSGYRRGPTDDCEPGSRLPPRSWRCRRWSAN